MARRLLSAEEVREARVSPEHMLDTGCLDINTAVRTMRSILRMTQPDYERRSKLTVRQVSKLENGHPNPTAETLERLSHPFGMVVGFVRRPPIQSCLARPIVQTYDIASSREVNSSVKADEILRANDNTRLLRQQTGKTHVDMDNEADLWICSGMISSEASCG